MASTYPTSLDVFTNPLTTNPLTAPSHAQQHSDINDAVEALEAKVAIGATVLGTYTTYTPTLLNVTIGNGILSSQYARVNDMVHYFGTFVLGSTSAITGSVSIGLPINMNAAIALNSMTYGTLWYYDVSGGLRYNGQAMYNASNSSVFAGTILTNQAYGIFQNLTASIPFTWTPADGDRFTWNLSYRV